MRCPILGNAQGQPAQGFEHLMEQVGAPVHCRELHKMAFKRPFQLEQFYHLCI